MNKLVAVLVLVGCMIWIVSPNYVQLYTDKIVTFAATTTSHSDSSLDCALACQLNHPCVSYAYHPGRTQCYLYDRVIHPADNTSVDEGIRTFTSEFGEQNIAFLKPTAQISTYNDLHSYNGVDGLKNSAMFHTNTNAWWCVDLSNVYELKWLAMYNIFDSK
ncbi:hypothetical protein SNE40_004843 [Patella caerulea]|uniref:Apple domain-containing protein n=1 Tax=Patella caerulea TaxID=87958 RepID=A0AAN8Q614_PATCE